MMKVFENKLPSDVFMKLMLYNSHPVADIMNQFVNDCNDDELSSIVNEYEGYDVSFYTLWGCISASKKADREYEENKWLDDEDDDTNDDDDDDDDYDYDAPNLYL